jgi:hypothetical protein
MNDFDDTATDGDAALARAALDALELNGGRLTALRVLERRDETRLRFNALAPVVHWHLAVAADTLDGRNYAGEIELFHWLEDGQWEVVEVYLDGVRDLQSALSPEKLPSPSSSAAARCRARKTSKG